MFIIWTSPFLEHPEFLHSQEQILEASFRLLSHCWANNPKGYLRLKVKSKWWNHIGHHFITHFALWLLIEYSLAYLYLHII